MVRLCLPFFGLLFVLSLRGQPASPPDVVTLDSAIQEAIRKNLDLAADKLNIPVAEAREIAARLRPNPVLTIGGQTLNLLGATYSPDTPLGPNQMNIHTDFPIERGHKREERIALAKEQKTLTGLEVREAMRQIIYAVQSAFVDILQAKERLLLARENLRSLEGVVTINEARLKNGDLAQVELERSRLAAHQYRTSVQQAELQLDQAKLQLQQLMGRKEGTAAFDVTGELRRDTLSSGREEIARMALEKRPDYLSGQQSQAASRADLRLQLANGKVDFVVGTEYTFQRAWGISGSSMGVYFSMPLKIFNKNQGEIARAQREINLAGARNEALAARIRNEVDKAYRQYSVSSELLANVESNMMGRARQVRDTTEYSYRRGEASLIEFLDAQRAFNDAMVTLYEARANYARSLYWIDAVSGTSVSAF